MNKTNSQINFLPFHFAMVLFDEATGKMIEMGDVVRYLDLSTQ